MLLALTLIIVVGGLLLAVKKIDQGQAHSPTSTIEKKQRVRKVQRLSSGKDVHIQYSAWGKP